MYYNDYNLYLGILCGYAQNAIINNVSVLGTINLITDITWIEIGGAIGYSKSCIINTSKSEVEIEINKTTTGKKYSNGAIYVGNFIGEDYYYTDGNQTVVSNCYAIGSINCTVTENTTGCVGGFIGGVSNYLIQIKNCFTVNSIDANLTYFLGGFISSSASAGGSGSIDIHSSLCVSNKAFSASPNTPLDCYATSENNIKNRQWVIDNLSWNEYDKNRINDGYVWVLVDNEFPKLYWEIY